LIPKQHRYTRCATSPTSDSVTGCFRAGLILAWAKQARGPNNALNLPRRAPFCAFPLKALLPRTPIPATREQPEAYGPFVGGHTTHQSISPPSQQTSTTRPTKSPSAHARTPWGPP
jgi:hypothetical protein